MRFALRLKPLRIALSGALLLLAPVAGFGAPAASAPPDVDRDYLEALQVANLFLNAWMIRDSAAGLELISDRLDRDLKGGRGGSWFEVYMSGLGNPHHQSYEIGPGRKRSTGRYAFPVRLFEIASRDRKGTLYESEIVIARQPDRWAVDELPKTPDNP